MRSPTTRRLTRLAALTLSLPAILAVAACGSSDKDSSATASAASTTGTTAASAPEGYTLRWGVVSISGKPTGPNGLAYSKGELLEKLKPAGVTDIEVKPFPNGPNLAAALIAGELDVGDLGDTPALVAGGQGIKAKLLQITQQNNEAWLIGRKGGPTDLQGLIGKKVATAPGSYMDRYLKGLIHDEGLDGKIQVGALLPPAGVSAIQSGALDAYAFPFPLGASLAEKGFPIIDKASDHEGLSGNSVTLISDSALADHPELPAAWRAATQASNAAVKADPDAYWAFEAANNKVTESASKASFPVENFPAEPFPADAITALQGTLDYLVETKQAKDFDIQQWEVPAS